MATAEKVQNDFDDEQERLYEDRFASNRKRLALSSLEGVTYSVPEGRPQTSDLGGQIGNDVTFAPPSAFRPPQRRPQISLQPIQEWEGCVTEIGVDHFKARLTDLSANDETESELGEFPISDLSDDDRELLREGAILRWVIGYQVLRGGTRQRISQVVFRRLPAWTKGDLAGADVLAADIISAIDWE